MMRRSFAGSMGSFCPTQASRRPLPLASTMIGVPPCDFAESPVARKVFVSIQPTTPLCGPPELVHSVVPSLAKNRWCVGKQVSTCDHLPVFGSYTEIWRGEASSGAIFADGWSEPFLQKSGFGAGRDRAENHTRPSRSMIALWMLLAPSQIGSLPQ